MALHKYLFKRNMRLAFVNEVDFEKCNITVYQEGSFEDSEYKSFLILNGIDDLKEEEKKIWEEAMEVFEVKQEY